MVKEIRLAGTFIEHNDEILMLHRISGTSQGGLWGIPGGKVNFGESDLDAAVREIFEETNFRVDPNKMNFHGIYNWKFSGLSIDLPTYILNLDKKFPVKLNPLEHQDYMWVSPESCYKREDLVHGVHDHLEIVYGNRVK